MSWASSWTSGLRTIGRFGQDRTRTSWASGIPRYLDRAADRECGCHGTGWVWVKLPEPVMVDVAEAMTVGLDTCPGCPDCAGRRA
jgi:hypothetical protein